MTERALTLTVSPIDHHTALSIARSKDKAILTAYEMLCQIGEGFRFDPVDYVIRKAAILAALDNGKEKG